MSFQTYLPVAPFSGMAHTGGSVNSPGVIQLYNPVGSGVTGWVYEISILTPSGLTCDFRPASVRMRRTTDPLTRGGGSSDGIYTTMRPDPSYTSNSSLTFTSFSFTSAASIFQDNQAQWFALPRAEGQNGWQPTYVRPGYDCFPISIQPGSALEFQPNFQGTTNFIKTLILWTEEP